MIFMNACKCSYRQSICVTKYDPATVFYCYPFLNLAIFTLNDFDDLHDFDECHLTFTLLD